MLDALATFIGYLVLIFIGAVIGWRVLITIVTCSWRSGEEQWEEKRWGDE